VNTVGGAAVGYVLGGNAGAVTGANADWNNRQLHDSEIRKIKNIAPQFAKEQNITEQQAADRLMWEAMRLVDKEYADKYSRDDTAAQAFLRKNTGSFTADGKRFTEFANMGYYNDPSKFAEQHGYSTERRRLYRQPVYTGSQKNAAMNAQVWSTIRQGVGKGIVNTPSTLLNTPVDWVNEFTHGSLGTIPNVPYAYGYDNEVEAAIGSQTSGTVLKLGSLATVMKTARPVPPKRFGFWNIDELKNSAREIDRGKLTIAGRALQKHGNREGSAFPSAQGNPISVNLQAEKIVNDILSNPNTIAKQRNTGRFGKVTDITAPDGRGLRYDSNGKLIGFLEPNK
nr:hypothetical protein [Neisseria sp. 51.81]